MAQGSLKKKVPPVKTKQKSVKRASESNAKTRKGAMIKDPKRAMLQQAHKEAQELTKAINADNEEHFTGVATSVPGGKLSVLKAPINTTADEKSRKKVSLRPGSVFGMGRK